MVNEWAFPEVTDKGHPGVFRVFFAGNPHHGCGEYYLEGEGS